MSEPVNYYEKIPKELRRIYHNPGFKKHGLNIPFRMLIIGGSGSGKTSTLMNLIKITSGTFEHIAVCLKSKHEPLYEYLESKLKDKLTFYENSVPDMKELELYKQSLIVFDDLVNTKHLQEKIADYAVRGRKSGISMVYISQSYYGMPKLIRLQAQYIVFKKLSSEKDLKLILKEYGFGYSLKEMEKIYNDATKKKEDWLLIDLEAENENKLRHNFKVIHPKKEEYSLNTKKSRKKKSIFDEFGVI